MIVLEELDERKGERGQKLSLSKDWRPVCKCRQNPKGKMKQHKSLLAEIKRTTRIIYSQVTTNTAQGIYFELQHNIQSCTPILRGKIMHVHWNASSCNQLSKNFHKFMHLTTPPPPPTHTSSRICCYTIFLKIFTMACGRGI